jgi:hypothetical protein
MYLKDFLAFGGAVTAKLQEAHHVAALRIWYLYDQRHWSVAAEEEKVEERGNAQTQLTHTQPPQRTPQTHTPQQEQEQEERAMQQEQEQAQEGWALQQEQLHLQQIEQERTQQEQLHLQQLDQQLEELEQLEQQQQHAMGEDGAAQNDPDGSASVQEKPAHLLYSWGGMGHDGWSSDEADDKAPYNRDGSTRRDSQRRHKQRSTRR